MTEVAVEIVLTAEIRYRERTIIFNNFPLDGLDNNAIARATTASITRSSPSQH
jgi:hypothetical protein